MLLEAPVPSVEVLGDGLLEELDSLGLGDAVDVPVVVLVLVEGSLDGVVDSDEDWVDVG